VHRSGPVKGKPQNPPDRPPPPGYICYRCGEIGHWIQACPTNNDPAFDGRPRVKRTTGIPRSFLKTVQKPTTLINDGTVDDSKQPSGVMVNAEGEWVIAEPDQATWDQYQAKTKVSAEAQEAASRGSKELQDRGLECAIDKRLFVDPTKTPCCNTTFCHECITNALLENDLRCPSCKTDDISLDNLKPDLDLAAQVRSYEGKEAHKKTQPDRPTSQEKDEPLSPTRTVSVKPQLPCENQSANKTSQKRPADSELVNDCKHPRPKEATTNKFPNEVTPSPSKGSEKKSTAKVATRAPPHENTSFMNPGSTNAMALPNMNMNSLMGMGLGLPMSMAPPMAANPVIQAPVMPAAYRGNDWNIMWAAGYPQANINYGQASFPSGIMPNAHYLYNSMSADSMNMPGMGISGASNTGQGMGNFANQQRTSFSRPSNGEEEAYFRKPVNPHRHQGRKNFQRPADYREI